MSFFKKLFGGGTPPEPEFVEYEGYRIAPEPMLEGNDYRIAARIEKDVNGETLTHHLIRADTMSDLSDAEAASVTKAKQMIDQQGDKIFR